MAPIFSKASHSRYPNPKAFSFVYYCWKYQENSSMQTRDIVDFVSLYRFPPAQWKSCIVKHVNKERRKGLYNIDAWVIYSQNSHHIPFSNILQSIII